MHGAAPPQTHPPSRLGKSCLCGTGAPCVCACRGPQGSLCEGRARAVLRCRAARCRACTARTAAHSCTAHPTAPRGGTLRAEGGVCERMGCCRACQAGRGAAPEGARADVVRASTRVLRSETRRRCSRAVERQRCASIWRALRAAGVLSPCAPFGARTHPQGGAQRVGGAAGQMKHYPSQQTVSRRVPEGLGRGATRWEALWDAPRRAARYGDACAPRIPIGRVKFAVRRTGAAQLRRRRFTSARATTFTALLRHTQHRARALRVFFFSSSSLSLGNRAYLG